MSVENVLHFTENKTSNTKSEYRVNRTMFVIIIHMDVD